MGIRILLVATAAETSVFDVYRGYRRTLERAGHDVRVYDLNTYLKFYTRAFSIGKTEQQVSVIHPEQIMLAATERVVTEALLHQAELVLIISGLAFHPNILELLKRVHIPVAVVLTECPYDDEPQLKFAELCDWAFVNDKASLPKFQEVTQAHYLPAAHDPEVHRMVPIQVGQDASYVLMVATWFPERVEFFSQINWDGVRLKLYGPCVTDDKKAMPWPKEHVLSPYYGGIMVDNHDIAALYATTKIGINIHRRHPRGYSINPRTYELAACGCFQLCDDSRPELWEIFGDSVPTFGSAQELEDQIHYYLAHDRARQDCIAKAMQAVQPHTFDVRVEDMMSSTQGKGAGGLKLIYSRKE